MCVVEAPKELPLPTCLNRSLEIVATRHDNADRNRAPFKKKPEVIQIAIIKWILVIPFDFKRYTIFEAIDLMSRTLNLLGIDEDLGVKVFFDPTPGIKCLIDRVRDF